MDPKNINNNPIESESYNTDRKTQSAKPEKDINNIFENCFNENEKSIIDLNKDGIISFDEVKSYINNSNAKEETLSSIADILGIEKEYILPFSKDSMFKYNSGRIIDNLKKVDSNGDNHITLDELNNINNLSNTEKAKIYNIFGLVDGTFINKQGLYGSCWALTAGYGIAKEAPEIFKQIVKKDDNGNIIVTFKGAGQKTFECKIDRKKIMQLIQKRTHIVNQNTINLYDHEKQDLRKYPSSDADAIALEIAFIQYEKQINKEKLDYKNKLIEYIKSSTPNTIVKPDVDKISTSMSQKEWNVIMNYYRNSDSPKKEEYLFPSSIDRVNEETISQMKSYIESSTPSQIVKPDISIVENGTFAVSNYIKNSSSKTVEKPKLIYRFNQVGSINTGGFAAKAITALAGGGYESFKNYKYNELGDIEPLSKQEKNNVKEILKQKNNNGNNKKIYTISFNENDKTVIKNHSYFISRVDNNTVYLVDPHDSNKEIAYSMKKLLNNFSILDINTLPE